MVSSLQVFDQNLSCISCVSLHYIWWRVKYSKASYYSDFSSFALFTLGSKFSSTPCSEMLQIQGYYKWLSGFLTTCRTQYTWDSSICIFLFNRTTLQVFVTYLTGALYEHPLWFYKHQHDNRVCSKLLVACQRWWFQWRFWFVPSVPSREMHNYCTLHIIKENFENFLIHRCNYILLSQVYCVWQVVKTPTVICNNPVL